MEKRDALAMFSVHTYGEPKKLFFGKKIKNSSPLIHSSGSASIILIITAGFFIAVDGLIVYLRCCVIPIYRKL